MRSSHLALSATILTAIGVRGHMAVWDPSAYGFIDPISPPTFPLRNQPFSEWWFHGNGADIPTEIKPLIPGESITLQISCNYENTTYGHNPSPEACPADSASYHAGGSSDTNTGWGDNDEANLAGCALAIAPTKNAGSTKPEDFVVMSILERCVRYRDTTFEIPSNLPECPEGECTCAWFWQGENSHLEMYMTGFRCNVIGGVATPFPTPVEPRRDAISGPTQPQYWANDLNNIGYTPDFGNRPSYNSRWGWTEGAQTTAFARQAEEPSPSPTTTASPVQTSGAFRRAVQPRVWEDYAPIPNLERVTGAVMEVEEEEDVQVEDEGEVPEPRAYDEEVVWSRDSERRPRRYGRGRVLA